MVSLACLKICFRPTATVLFFFISRSPLHCALSASILGSVSHPVGDRPSHPICEVRFSECGPRTGLAKVPLSDNCSGLEFSSLFNSFHFLPAESHKGR